MPATGEEGTTQWSDGAPSTIWLETPQKKDTPKPWISARISVMLSLTN